MNENKTSLRLTAFILSAITFVLAIVLWFLAPDGVPLVRGLHILCMVIALMTTVLYGAYYAVARRQGDDAPIKAVQRWMALAAGLAVAVYLLVTLSEAREFVRVIGDSAGIIITIVWILLAIGFVALGIWGFMRNNPKTDGAAPPSKPVDQFGRPR